MTETAKIQMLRSITDSDDSDETLAAFLAIGAEEVLNKAYPFVTDRSGLTVPAIYEMTQIQIASYFLNKRGAEGEIQHIENGIHRNYGSSGVPEAMVKHITPFCGVVV